MPMKASAALSPLTEPSRDALPLARARVQAARTRAQAIDETNDARMRRALAERATRPAQARVTAAHGYGDLVAAARAQADPPSAGRATAGASTPGDALARAADAPPSRSAAGNVGAPERRSVASSALPPGEVPLARQIVAALEEGSEERASAVRAQLQALPPAARARVLDEVRATTSPDRAARLSTVLDGASVRAASTREAPDGAAPEPPLATAAPRDVASSEAAAPAAARALGPPAASMAEAVAAPASRDPSGSASPASDGAVDASSTPANPAEAEEAFAADGVVEVAAAGASAPGDGAGLLSPAAVAASEAGVGVAEPAAATGARPAADGAASGGEAAAASTGAAPEGGAAAALPPIAAEGSGVGMGPPLELHVAALPRGGAATDEAREIQEAVGEAARAGLAQLEATTRRGLVEIQRSVATEQRNLDAVGAQELATVGQAFTRVRGQVARSLGQARRQVAATALAQRQRLDAWHTGARQRTEQAFSTRQARVRRLGGTKGDEAVATADRAAQDARSRIEGYAGQARQTGEAKARSARGASREIVEARQVAAQGVAGNTAAEVTQSLAATVNELRGLGPETRPQFVQQANQLASQLGEQLPTILGQLGQTRQGAAGALGTGAAGGAQAFAQLEASLGQGLGALERSVRVSLREGVAGGRQALGAAGRQAADAVRAQHDAASQAGADVVATIFATVPNRRLRRAVARRLAAELRGRVQAGFLTTEQRARLAMAETAQCFAQAALETFEAVRAQAEQARGQAETFGAEAATSAQGQVEQLVQQLTEVVTGAVQSGDQVVGGAERGLDATIADIDGRFSQAISDFRAQLQQRVTEAASNAREPLGTLDGRIEQGMARAEERVNQSWLERQWSDLVESVNWGMLAGLLVGILVTIAVVALIGTGIGALIVAGALAGALSVAATTLTNDAIAGRDTNWGELGRNMLIGAAFGAVGGVLGGGVTGALGKGVMQGLVTEATSIALGKAANVATGVVLGIVQNVVQGDPWDKNLLFNVAQGVAFTYGPLARGMQRVSEGARAMAVDRGVALHVTPTEAAASAARRGSSSTTEPSGATAARPEEATAARPEEATAARPEEATAARPEEATAARPEEATAARPEEATAARPEEATAARPEEATAARPEEATAARPEEARADGEIPNGEPVAAEQPTADGRHKVKVTEDGRAFVCSTCEELQVKYRSELEANEGLQRKWEENHNIADPEAKAKACAELQRELAEARAKSRSAETPEVKAKRLADTRTESRSSIERIRKILSDPANKEFFEKNGALRRRLEGELRALEDAWNKAVEDAKAIEGDSELSDVVSEDFDDVRTRGEMLENEVADAMRSAGPREIDIGGRKLESSYGDDALAFFEDHPEFRSKFDRAMEKGLVPPKGSTGIVRSELPGYDFKLKILGVGGDFRIHGKIVGNKIVWNKVTTH
ncbi:hypothetical protein [Sorangium cellulosum]|uniref:hypothetical protein n=1 Tax=Sorangium cellulosum TaxID=56 RepID=UPI0005D148C8|nr:hypothetical protein [Sorangium cellulosum]